MSFRTPWWLGAVCLSACTVTAPLERLCDDGEDDDDDGLADCADPDCAGWAACQLGACAAERTVGCGEVISGHTSEGVSRIGRYGCPAEDLGGPERVFRFRPPVDGLYSARVTGATLVVIEEEVTPLGERLGCDRTECAALGREVTFAAQDDRDYFFIVDAPAPAPFTLEIECPAGLVGEGRCADAADGDGDGLADCADPDCAAAPWCGGDGGGCGTPLDLGCDAPATGQHSARHADFYLCDGEALDQPTADTVLRFVAPVAGHYRLEGHGLFAQEHRLVLLRDQGGGCDPRACEDDGRTVDAELDEGEQAWVVVEGDPVIPFGVALACPAVPASGACASQAALRCGDVVTLKQRPGPLPALACGVAPATGHAVASFVAVAAGQVAFVVTGAEGAALLAAGPDGCDLSACLDQGAIVRADVAAGDALFLAAEATAAGPVTVLVACAGPDAPAPQTCQPQGALACDTTVTLPAASSMLDTYVCQGNVDDGRGAPEAVADFVADGPTRLKVQVSAGKAYLLLSEGDGCEPAQCLDSGTSVDVDLQAGQRVYLVVDAEDDAPFPGVTIETSCEPLD